MEGKHWCITINNPTETDKIVQKDVKYAIWQLEKGENGTTHIQAYVELAKKKKLSCLKKIWPKAHLENTRDIEASIKYCQKQETRIEGPWTHGERTKTKPGKRTDIETVREMVKNGASMSEIAPVVAYQGCKYAEMLIKYSNRKRTEKPYIEWIYGPTGCGKTAYATTKYPNAKIIEIKNGFWLGYDGQKEIIIDDYRIDMMPFRDLLRVLDRYEYQVNTKGSTQSLLATTIIVTAPMEPSRYTPGGEDPQQLIRRIDIVRNMMEPATEVKGNTIDLDLIDNIA